MMNYLKTGFRGLRRGMTDFLRRGMTAESFVAAVFILIGIASRLFPHLPNVTALTSVCVLSATFLSQRKSMVLVLTTLILSDAALAYQWGFTIFGDWTLFTFSGFMMIAWGSYFAMNYSAKIRAIYFLSSSFGFWVWTNFGTWLTGHLYPMTASGLILCYTAALPFLRNQLLGDISWMLVMLMFLACLRVVFGTKLVNHNARTLCSHV